ncbi:hypothetical protein CBR_g11881 [Chara braunii]|uniref:Reverse transcriptase RNase H-like domain-containing protein n=1 Tax=Chara braunii TaxID=69332 RepID=A0A388JS80_CHABU|nr:hypothetical protein CBR_g11881 [Chara braunii]|eukprot:GBG60656.1 hypothetical protein CBR_g11881 [Chara braunii]
MSGSRLLRRAQVYTAPWLGGVTGMRGAWGGLSTTLARELNIVAVEGGGVRAPRGGMTFLVAAQTPTPAQNGRMLLSGKDTARRDEALREVLLRDLKGRCANVTRAAACPREGGKGELEALGYREGKVLKVIVDSLAEVEVIAMVILRRQRGNNVLLTTLERAEAAREVAALLRGTAGATVEKRTALRSVMREGGSVTSTLGLGGGSGVTTGPNPPINLGSLVHSDPLAILAPTSGLRRGKQAGDVDRDLIRRCAQEGIRGVSDLEIVNLALAANEERKRRDSWWTVTSQESEGEGTDEDSSEEKGGSKEEKNSEDNGDNSEKDEPGRLVQMMVVPMGWTNGVAMFQRAMIAVLKEFIPEKVEVFLDDFPIKGPVERDETEVFPGVKRFVANHMRDVRNILEKLDDANLMVRQFLGVVGYWRIFIKAYGEKAEPLRRLLRKSEGWVWGEEQVAAMEALKEEFREGGEVLGVPFFEDEESRPFIVSTDAGPHSVGGILSQKDGEGKEKPLRFESRTLNPAERNYSQFKKEVLGVLHCLKAFRHYLYGRRFLLRVDPTAVAPFLQKDLSLTDPTIARWMIHIRLYDYSSDHS